MINLETIKNLNNNDGLTLKNGEPITYKTGWQVATDGVECTTPEDTLEAVKMYDGNCGIWFADGIYYIDNSKRVNTKTEALKIGRRCNQISILKWSDMSLAYC
jgi:hypothetical protein